MAEYFEGARCAGSGEDFYPEHGQSAAKAKALCRQCPIQERCLSYALEHREPYGVWGGLSPDERRVRLGLRPRRR